MIDLRFKTLALAAAVPLALVVSEARAQMPAAGDKVGDDDVYCNCLIVASNGKCVREASNSTAVLVASSQPVCPAPAAPAPAPAAPPPPPPAPKQFIIYFNFDRANIRPDAAATLDQVAAEARRSGASSFSLTGYTDRAGPVDYNLKLSLRRAESTRSWLTQNGFSPAAISVAGRGEADPAVPTPDGVPNQANRRVVIVME